MSEAFAVGQPVWAVDGGRRYVITEGPVSVHLERGWKVVDSQGDEWYYREALLSATPPACGADAVVAAVAEACQHVAPTTISPNYLQAVSAPVFSFSGLTITPLEPYATAGQMDRLMMLLKLTAEERAFAQGVLCADTGDASFWPMLADYLLEKGETEAASKARPAPLEDAARQVLLLVAHLRPATRYRPACWEGMDTDCGEEGEVISEAVGILKKMLRGHL